MSGNPILVQDNKININWGNKYSSYIDGTHKEKGCDTLFTIDEKKRMKIVKGDTAIFNITINNYEFVDGDKVYFTVKTSVDDADNIIQKVVTSFNANESKIILSKEDTNIDVGVYLYDIQCSLANGIVDTVIPPTKFEVIGGITHD